MKFLFSLTLILLYSLQLSAGNNKLNGNSKVNSAYAMPFSGKYALLQHDENDSLPAEASHETLNIQKKSVGKAFLYSLAIPGAGQYYLEQKNSALLFFGIEIVAWAGLLTNQLYTDHLKDEYYAYASQHAGVIRDGKDKQYWISIGKYDDIYAYNNQRLSERRFDELYPENRNNYWQWDSKENRYVYDGKRIRANEIADQDIYFWGAIALNHLASAIHAMAKARQYNNDIDEKISWRIKFKSFAYQNSEHFYGFKLSAHF